MKLFICGSRTIDNIKWISTEIEKCIAENQLTDITILEGYTNIVESVAGGWATINNIPEITYPSELTYHQRHEAMTKDCDFMLVLWNGEYVDCFYDIMMAEKYHKPYKVCIYSCTKTFATAVDDVLTKNKALFNASENVTEVFSLFNKYIYKAIINNSYIKPEWIEGHDSGSCFWIMPVKQGKDSSDGDWGCYCCCTEEISIEEDIIFDYLYYPFLKPYFDTSIKYTCRENDPPEFDWYGYNLYTYDAVRKMTNKMKQFSEDNFFGETVSEFYRTLADRLVLMMERNPDWDFITFEGP